MKNIIKTTQRKSMFYFYSFNALKQLLKSIKPEALPCSFGDGPQCHWLLDLCKRRHYHQAGERRKSRVARVVVGKIVVGILAVQFPYKEKNQEKHHLGKPPISDRVFIDSSNHLRKALRAESMPREL